MLVYDVIVIGGGQSGLSMGYYLQQTNLNFLILDQNPTVGDSWRNRYDSLVLFTPHSYSSLPGLKLTGEKGAMPSKNEIADYVTNYADTFSLPVKNNVRVTHVTKKNDLFVIKTDTSTLHSYHIVIATGPFHTPRIPSLSQDISKNVLQLHSSSYKNPTQLNKGTTLVVGGGNSGAQIAAELAAVSKTYLSISQSLRFLPLTLANKPIFWWFEKLGILRTSSHSFIGKKLQKQPDPIFGYDVKQMIKTKKLDIKPRTIGTDGREIVFSDQTTLEVTNIIWATGFQIDYSWIEIPELFDDDGEVKHNRGITSCKGAFFLGLPWQSKRGSALLQGVGDDAYYIYEHLVTSLSP